MNMAVQRIVNGLRKNNMKRAEKQVWENMQKGRVILCLGLMLILCVSQLPNLSATTNNITLNPIEDSYIELHDPDSNFGAGSSLKVWGEEYFYEGAFGKKSYLKFDLSSIPSSASIISGELELYMDFKVTQTCSIGVHYCSNNNWDELLITWNNAPSFESASLDVCSPIAFGDKWYSWTVTDAVQKAFSTRVLTLVLNEADENEDIVSFDSKDSYYSWSEDTRPKLTITYISEETNVQPDAGFTYYPSGPTTDDTIQFTDASSDSDGTISSWHWNFGDDYETSKQNPQHKYSSSGTYTITLEIIDNDGGTDSVSKTVTIKSALIEEPTDENGETNGGTTDDTPGFELIMLICSIAFVFLWKCKRQL